jgi:hypothetical protein
MLDATLALERIRRPLARPIPESRPMAAHFEFAAVPPV